MAAVICKLTHVDLGRPRFPAGYWLEASASGHVILSIGLLTTQHTFPEQEGRVRERERETDRETQRERETHLRR